MKKKVSLIAVLVGLVLCSAAVAYIPYLIVRECPHCQAYVVQEDTVSGNTIGAVLYTDGRRYAPMLPDHPWLAKCPTCSGLFWVDEAVEVDSGFEAAEGKQKVLAPSERDLLDFLAGPVLPRDKELYLRMHAWWAANDVWRWLPNPKPAFSKDQAENLKALSLMLDERQPAERIMKAEIARELGSFEECRWLLLNPFDEAYQGVVSFIRKLAEDRVRGVRPFRQAR
jgi:hypothetical protein